MLEKLIEKYDQHRGILLANLVDQVQPYVNRFCDKYDISFAAIWGTWYFDFGNVHHKPDEEFLKQLDPDLFEALNYKHDSNWELGIQLQQYKITLTPTELVYIYCDHNIERRWLSDKALSTEAAEYGLMSRKLAQSILNNPELDLTKW